MWSSRLSLKEGQVCFQRKMRMRLQGKSITNIRFLENGMNFYKWPKMKNKLSYGGFHKWSMTGLESITSDLSLYNLTILMKNLERNSRLQILDWDKIKDILKMEICKRRQKKNIYLKKFNELIENEENRKVSNLYQNTSKRLFMRTVTRNILT